MFFTTQPQNEKEKYEHLLKILGSLSYLFSDSDTPYLYYRWAERAFCKAFWAIDHSRWDTAIDAGKNGVGIWLKTFLEWNNKTFQKVAEFNKESVNFRSLVSNPESLVREISRLRNERLSFAQRTHQVELLAYHCVTRKPGNFIISEEEMSFIDLDRITDIKANPTTVYFRDWKHQYNFSITKSTLLKQFELTRIHSFDVEILKDPFKYLEEVFNTKDAVEIKSSLFWSEEKEVLWSVILPLYSEKWGINVPESSGLNQWNAGGRKRRNREVYISIPAWIHKEYLWFFPDRNTHFNLILPNWKTIIAKVCQDGSKALMSNPNTDLGEWLIDEVLKLPDGKIVTYKDLQIIWIDSVEIAKIWEGNFTINFKKIWSYEAFKEQTAEEIEEND